MSRGVRTGRAIWAILPLRRLVVFAAAVYAATAWLQINASGVWISILREGVLSGFFPDPTIADSMEAFSYAVSTRGLGATERLVVASSCSQAIVLPFIAVAGVGLISKVHIGDETLQVSMGRGTPPLAICAWQAAPVFAVAYGFFVVYGAIMHGLILRTVGLDWDIAIILDVLLRYALILLMTMSLCALCGALAFVHRRGTGALGALLLLIYIDMFAHMYIAGAPPGCMALLMRVSGWSSVDTTTLFGVLAYSVCAFAISITYVKAAVAARRYLA